MKWEKVKLGECIKVKSGVNLTQESMDLTGCYPVYGGNGITGHHTSYNVNESTIIIGRVGYYCGSVHLTEDKAWITDNAFITSFSEDLFFPKYLFYALKQIDLRRYSNSSAQPVISGAGISKVEISCPPLHIQEQIADTLDKADALRRKDQELLQKYDELAQSIFYDMFGDPVQNDKGWMKCFLKDLVEVKGGKRLPIGSDFATTITDHPYIRVKDFENQSVKLSDLKYITAETHRHISRYIINTGDVYISIAGTIGLCGTVPDVLDGANLTENAAKLVIRDKNLLTPAYLSAFLMSPYSQGEITKRTMAVGVPKLALFRIEELEILLPPLEVQNNYVHRLMKLSDIKLHSQKSQEQTEVLFSSCLIDSFS